ncbi:MAG: TonB-dependent receptor [Bryobacterales bacterium]|nr:TonB-dependent receptor [Bryobacteraceae bacterium]MDW8130152.1 TonB-dependent receptor [Bryobacterales bacterium]
MNSKWCVLIACALWASAQSTDAVLSGTVLDPSGAAVPGVTVIAENVKTGVASTVTSNEAGVYLFAALPPGTYRITVEHPGFRRFVYQGLVLEVGGRVQLNIPLELGPTAETVEVTAQAATPLGYVTSSVGGMVAGRQITDLPIPARNALSLVYIQAGVVGDNFSGARIGTLNITLDGINVQDNRINSGVSSPIFTSTDRVEEFRVITSPADAELGRGSGQIQMISRSGTNEFHGSVFETHRNTVLTANTFFNNQRGDPRNFLIRNQFGGRLGGPILRNRTFFHVVAEFQRIRTRDSVSSTVYTEPARRGIFRFFPGVRNGNANATVPTVDLAGNPVRPPQATGDLQQVLLFGRDPNRTALDPAIRKLIELMPLPNNFRGGDGLNTAWYTWRRSASQDFDHFNLKLDHIFTSSHRASFSYTKEYNRNDNTFMPQPLPQAPGGDSRGWDSLSSLAVTSTLRPDLLNEFRAGALRPRLRFRAPWEVAGLEVLPKAGQHPYLIEFGLVTNPLNADNDPQGRITPVYQFSNDLTWLRGRHAFKSGVTVRFTSSNGFNSFDVMPRATIGTGSAPIQNLSTIPGIGLNLATAESLLNELSGSVARVRQAFNSPGGPDPQFVAGEGKQRTWKQREFAWYFKDDFKVTPDLTLNLGVRYEFYSVPWDANGKAASLVGGSGAIFGISGTSFADMYQPGRMAGSLTRVHLVGKRSPNPRVKLYENDWNNFAPAVGLSWSLPWFGKGKTILRMGYGIGYERNSLRLTDVVAGDLPGLREVKNFTSPDYLDLSRIRLPLAADTRPLAVVPLTDRLQIVRVFDTGLRSPYVQNWNLSLQRQLRQNAWLEVRYVGNKGTRLIRGTSVNETNIFENGILEAFLLTQAGANAPLLDRIFHGLNVPGLGVVDGVNRTGSDAVRTISTTQGHLANNHVASFAAWLNNTDMFTGERGGLLRRAGLPENWIVVNPQFDSARLTSNFASSIYHALQVEVVKRFGAGWSFQGNYTFSKVLGEEEGAGQEMIDSYRNLRNWRMDRRRLTFDRTHVFRNSGIWELPFGPGKPWLSSGGWLGHLVGGWQVGFIFNLFSGQPMSLSSGANTWNTFGDNTPDALAPIPKGWGKVQRTGLGVVYFQDAQQVADPGIQRITTRNNIAGRSTLRAIADANGRVLLANPAPGTLGNLAPMFLEGPGAFRFDVNLIKRIRVAEGKTLELRADALDVANKPEFGNPTTDINSVNFGRITSAGANRVVVVGLRFSF